MDTGNSIVEQKDRQWRLFIYLIPVIGVFPAIWTLYRGLEDPQQRAASRLTVTLAFSWLLGHILLGLGSQTAESVELPLLLTSSLLTTSYFIICLGLMIRVWRCQPLWLPGLSRVSEEMLKSHLPE